eukprot:ANDGO_00237.mRNA.1 77 kDa echinoderm microtubule-associated protein
MSATIIIKEARGLTAADDSGKSDPYVVVKLNGTIVGKTKPVAQTLSPVWDYTANVASFAAGTIQFDVYDKDEVGKDDRLGSAVVKTRELFAGTDVMGNDLWLPLSTKGELHVLISVPEDDGTGDDSSYATATDVDDADLDDEFKTKVDLNSSSASASAPAAAGGDEDEIGVVVETATTEQAMAIKPFLGALVAPSGYVKKGDADAAPNASADLSYVFGYRSHDVRSNLFVATDDASGSTVLYHTAALGVRLNVAKNEQSVFRGKHTDDVVSIAYHAESGKVVTGQMGKNPLAFVYDGKSLSSAVELKSFHKRAVIALAFSHDGKYIASVGDDDDHSIAVHDAASGALLASSTGDKNKITSVKFAPTSYEFTTTGVKHVKVWTFTPGGRTLAGKRGIFGTRGELQTIATGAYTAAGLFVSATQSGDLYVWKGERLAKVVEKAHAGGAVVTVAYDAKSDVVLTGGRDGCIKAWSGASLKALGTVAKNLSSFVSSETVCEVRSIALCPNSRKLYAGLKQDSSIRFLGTLDVNTWSLTAAKSGSNVVMAGHAGEAWGLAVNPKDNAISASGGDEGAVLFWDTAKRTVCGSINVSQLLSLPAGKTGVRGFDFHPDGRHIAVGCTSGAVAVLEVEDGRKSAKVIWSAKDTAREVDQVRFSPSGKYVAAGAHDGFIRVYNTNGGLKCKCSGHHSTITHIDWSADDAILQSNSLDYELLFWDINNGGAQIKSPSSIKDTKWESFTCVLGWPVQGIFPPYSDFTDVNAASRSPSQTLIATAEDSGLVCLYKYPAIGSGYDHRGKIAKRPDRVTLAGHSSHVTNVAWANSDKTLVSLGGNDRSVFVWAIRN